MKKMHMLSKRTKWMVRYGLANVHKMLCPIIGVKRLKQNIAKLRYKREIDLDIPKKLNEKILYMAYNYDTSEWSRLADKYEVRQYVENKGLKEILVPIYGIYESYDEIDLRNLPEKFVLKATHGCDMNYLCKEKAHIVEKELKRQVNFWLNHNLAFISLELHYLNIKPRVICEAFLETGDREIIDYKFFCFHGEVRFVEVCSERSKGPYLDIFTMDWEAKPEAIVGAKNNPNELKKPETFQQMTEIANKLSEGFPFVRVDLYEVEGKVYFGEMTFTPATGLLFHFSEEFLLEQGKYCQI